MAYLLLYVDDIILTASSLYFLTTITSSMAREFAMKDLGPLHHFLGISVTRSSTGLHLSQWQYILDILSRAGMRDCHPVTTPIDTKAKLPSSLGSLVHEPSLYRSLAGALQYATLTRPDIAYAVQQLCLHIHDPRVPHFSLIKSILRYLNDTLHHGLTLHSTSLTYGILRCRLGWMYRHTSLDFRVLHVSWR